MVEVKQMQDFWSEHPCGTVGSFKDLADHRYKTEPYLIKHLYDICDKLSHNAKVLEIGCGQGTDALFMCSLLSNNVGYYGIDFSIKSVEIADKNKSECISLGKLNCIPEFAVGDACDLQLQDGAFDFVYSMGVIHHIANMDARLKKFIGFLRVVVRHQYTSTEQEVQK